MRPEQRSKSTTTTSDLARAVEAPALRAEQVKEENAVAVPQSRARAAVVRQMMRKKTVSREQLRQQPEGAGMRAGSRRASRRLYIRNDDQAAQ